MEKGKDKEKKKRKLTFGNHIENGSMTIFIQTAVY